MAPKNIAKEVPLPEPKLWVVSKMFLCAFVNLRLYLKILGQAFFHQDNILGVISFTHLGPVKRLFRPFLPKTTHLVKKYWKQFVKMMKVASRFFLLK